MTRKGNRLAHRQAELWKAYKALAEVMPGLSPETVQQMLQEIEETERVRPSAVELWLKDKDIWQLRPGPMAWD